MISFRRSISQLLRLPSVCILCKDYHRNPYALCENCFALMPKMQSACYHCAHPLPPSASTLLICGPCSIKKPYYNRAYIAYRFEEPLRKLLHDYKYHKEFFLRHVIANLMLDALPSEGLDTQCLVPVPLHPKKLRERGFNQTAELCKLLSKQVNIPYHLGLCKKIRHTVPQAHLLKKDRQRNLRQAFAVKPHAYQRITLIDDLLTTGSTISELTQLFKQQGAETVDVWCCARA